MESQRDKTLTRLQTISDNLQRMSQKFDDDYSMTISRAGTTGDTIAGDLANAMARLAQAQVALEGVRVGIEIQEILREAAEIAQEDMKRLERR